MLKKNYFPTNLVDKCIKIFLKKQFSQKILEHAVPKKELFIVLQYLGMPSLCLRTRLKKSINSNTQLFGEHSVISPLTNKRSKSKSRLTAVKDHMLVCDQPVSFDDFKELASSNSEFHLKIRESLIISRDQPVLNKNEASLPLHLFD